MRVRINTPVEDHNGAVGDVLITQGVGYADTEIHAAELAYCRANGYNVTEVEPEPGPKPASETQDEVPMPRKSGSAEAWRAYAVAHGIPAEEAEQLSRDLLVERFTTTEDDPS